MITFLFFTASLIWFLIGMSNDSQNKNATDTKRKKNDTENEELAADNIRRSKRDEALREINKESYMRQKEKALLQTQSIHSTSNIESTNVLLDSSLKEKDLIVTPFEKINILENYQVFESAVQNSKIKESYSTFASVGFEKNEFSCYAIKKKSVKLFGLLSEERRNKAYNELNKGIAILDSDDQLNAYNYSFSRMHQEKLKAAFQICHFNNYLNLKGLNIEIIDYGCGQGIGTVALIDFLKLNNIRCLIEKVILIEPSALALDRAELNVKGALKNSNQIDNVVCMRNRLEDIDQSQLKTTGVSVKIHILSNILDVEGFDIIDLCNKISLTQKGQNIFFCVSPKFQKYGVHPRNARMNNFLLHFQKIYDVNIISQRDTDIISRYENVEKIWTRYEIIFDVHMSTLEY